jgi:hypothetical protein
VGLDRSGRGDEERRRRRKPLLCRESNSGRSAYSLVTILTELYRLIFENTFHSCPARPVIIVFMLVAYKMSFDLTTQLTEQHRPISIQPPGLCVCVCHSHAFGV